MRRKIACKYFFTSEIMGKNHHLYEDQLGFPELIFREAMTTSDKEVLRYYLVTGRHDDLRFFYPKDRRWYFVHNWWKAKIILLRLRIHPRYVEGEHYVECSLTNEDYRGGDYADHAEVLIEMEDRNAFIETAEINGEKLYDIVAKSWLPVV